MAQYIVSKLGPDILKKPVEITATTWDKINPPARRPVYTAMTSMRFAELGLTPLPDWRAALSSYLALRQ